MPVDRAVFRFAQIALATIFFVANIAAAQSLPGGGRQRSGAEKGNLSRSAPDRNAAARRSGAMRDMKDKVAALVTALTTEQRRMFDRRIALALREPLGGF